MSLTAVIWCLMFFGFAVMSFTRPIWGVALYLLSVFAFPPLWWWGKGTLAGQHWGLYTGLILLASSIIGYRPAAPTSKADFEPGLLRLCMLLFLVNSYFVTFVFGYKLEISMAVAIQQSKFLLLMMLIDLAIRTEADFDFFLMIISFGAGYLGYEATINNRGNFKAGRLENFGVPGAFEANSIASLMATILPVMGGLIFTQRGWRRVVVFVMTPLAVNVVLLCSSRGAILALIIAAMAMFVIARGKERGYVRIGLFLGAFSLLFLLRDSDIIDRFMTTFSGEEVRDTSSSSRLKFWGRGLQCLLDHPLGTGGDGFKRHYAAVYMPDLFTGTNRAVHQGYLNEGLQWGLQGLSFRLGIFLMAVLCLRHGQLIYGRLGDYKRGFMAVCIIAGLTAFCVCGFFTDYWDSEWGLWLCAISPGYLRCARQREEAELVSAPSRQITHESLPAPQLSAAGVWNPS